MSHLHRRNRHAGETPCPPDMGKSSLARDEAAGGTALLIIDMLGDWQFPTASELLGHALAIAPAIQSLRARCKAVGVPVIYANDNHGRWRSDFHALVDGGLQLGGQRERLNRLLLPDEDDYFVLKPKQSAFFATPLDLLLSHLKVHRLLVTGVASDQCVLATVIDARMRDYEVLCPRDCLATHEQHRHDRAMRHLAEVLHLETKPTHEINLKDTP